ncbi:MAG: polysaccharide deacetylase family protein [Gammaproteobacteria bacterium]|nr:polysaccharide deacetylase family protein [Gammaproteobacteria bacterium]
MNILHILSQHQVTGAETYAATLANKHSEAGHNVWMVSDTLTTATKAIYISSPIGKRTFLQRLINIIRIRKLIKQHQIDIVHTHSRAATWIGYFSTRFSPAGLVSTVHGRQSLRISKRILDVYGHKVIAVCDNIRTHLCSQLKMDAAKLCVIPNAIDFIDTPPSAQDSHTKILSIVGRTTGPKGQRTAELLSQVFPLLLKAIPELEIRIIGGEANQLPPEGQIQLYQLQKTYPDRVQMIGFVTNLPVWLAQSTCNIAAGRVAIESLLCHIPTVALGEADFEGLICESNLSDCLASNFGDINAYTKQNPLDYERIYETLYQALINPVSLSPELSLSLKSLYDSKRVADEIMEIYRSVTMRLKHPKHIPLLMYHKVLNEERTSKHRVYVTQKRFRDHMQSLKKRKFTSLTFKDYLAFRNGDKPLSEFPNKPVIISFDDGYVNNLDLALPILQEYGFKAVIFALGDFTVANNFWDIQNGEPEDLLMNAEQLKYIANAGMEIGAHSLSHRDLTKLTSEEAYHEILQSKLNLEQLVGTEVISFAYPYGYYSEAIKVLTKQAGFKMAVATDRGGLHIEQDLFEVFRVAIFPSDTPWKFWKKTQNWYRAYYMKKRGH